MFIKPRISIRILMAIIVVCCVGTWLAKRWLYPNRIPGRRIALIGPLDIDGDGLDDRVKLKAMILRNGRTVDYDLPVSAPGSGDIGPRTSWYVVGETRRGSSVPAPFLKARANAISQARLNGVPPLTLKKLLARLGAKQ
jgi:hypothetical protein